MEYRKPVLIIAFIFCVIGILLSFNFGSPEIIHNTSQGIKNDMQFPWQETAVWYSPSQSQVTVQEFSVAKNQKPIIESNMIQGVLLLSVVIVILSTRIVSRRASNEHVVELRSKNPEVEAIRILEMDHKRARIAIAELHGAYRMEVLQLIVAHGSTAEDFPTVQMPTEQKLDLINCG